MVDLTIARCVWIESNQLTYIEIIWFWQTEKKQLNNRNKTSVPRVIFLEEEKIERFKWFSILRIDCK